MGFLVPLPWQFSECWCGLLQGWTWRLGGRCPGMKVRAPCSWEIPWCSGQHTPRGAAAAATASRAGPGLGRVLVAGGQTLQGVAPSVVAPDPTARHRRWTWGCHRPGFTLSARQGPGPRGRWLVDDSSLLSLFRHTRGSRGRAAGTTRWVLPTQHGTPQAAGLGLGDDARQRPRAGCPWVPGADITGPQGVLVGGEPHPGGRMRGR